jgi:hypothetical protein
MIERRAYTTKRGVYVEPTCIPDKGQEGKGPYTLPPIDTKMSLRRYGYSLKLKGAEREKALKRAAKKYPTLSLLRRVSLLRNYMESDEKMYKKLSHDLKFLQRKYKDEKHQKEKQSKQSKTNNRSTKRSTKQSTKRSNKRSTKRSTKRSNKRSTKYVIHQ